MKLVEFPKNHLAKKVFNINNEAKCDRCMQYIKIMISSYNINIILETKTDATLLTLAPWQVFSCFFCRVLRTAAGTVSETLIIIEKSLEEIFLRELIFCTHKQMALLKIEFQVINYFCLDVVGPVVVA